MGGCSHAEVSVEKVKLAAEEVGGPVMCEDTSLCFNALNGSHNPPVSADLPRRASDPKLGALRQACPGREPCHCLCAQPDGSPSL